MSIMISSVQVENFQSQVVSGTRYVFDVEIRSERGRVSYSIKQFSIGKFYQLRTKKVLQIFAFKWTVQRDFRPLQTITVANSI